MEDKRTSLVAFTFIAVETFTSNMLWGRYFLSQERKAREEFSDTVIFNFNTIDNGEDDDDNYYYEW